jgi:hypothetical protein
VKKTWFKRIERLEAIVLPHIRKHAVFRFGYLRSLPPDCSAERHVTATHTETTALAHVEHCAFEERVGPAQAPTPDLSFTVYLKKDQGHDGLPSP